MRTWIAAASLALSLAACGGAAAPGAPPVIALTPIDADAGVAAPVASAASTADGGPSAANDAKEEAERARLDNDMLAALNGGAAQTGALGAAQPSPTGSLHLGPGSGPVAPGSATGGLGQIGGIGGVAPSQGDPVRGPVGRATPRILAGADAIPNAARVVAGMASGFRRCYQKALLSDPTIAGAVDLTVQIDAGGSVSAGKATVVSGNKDIKSDLTGCLVTRARAAQFDPPAKPPATVKLQVTLVHEP